MSDTTKTITINVTDLKKKLKQQLSLIGKRQSDKQGNTLFAGATLSSNEEAAIDIAIHGAAQTFARELAPKITSYSESTTSDSIAFNASGLNNAKGTVVADIFVNYAIAFVCKATLGKNYPELAKEFADEMASYLESGVGIAYSIDPPTSSDKTLADMTGTMYNDDGTAFMGVI